MTEFNWSSVSDNKEHWLEVSTLEAALDVAKPSGIIAVNMHTMDKHISHSRTVKFVSTNTYADILKGHLGRIDDVQIITDTGEHQLSWLETDKFYVYQA